MKTLTILITAAVLLGSSLATLTPSHAEDQKRPTATAPTPSTLDRDLKAMEALLAFHEKDAKMATDGEYRSSLCKKLKEMYDAKAAELKDLWADLAGSMIKNNYGTPQADKNTKVQQDAKFRILDALEKRLKAIQERIDKLCPCPPAIKFDWLKGMKTAGPPVPVTAPPHSVGGKK